MYLSVEPGSRYFGFTWVATPSRYLAKVTYRPPTLTATNPSPLPAWVPARFPLASRRRERWGTLSGRKWPDAVLASTQVAPALLGVSPLVSLTLAFSLLHIQQTASRQRRAGYMQ